MKSQFLTKTYLIQACILQGLGLSTIPKGQVQAQQAQYNKFIESGQKNWALMSVTIVESDLRNE